MLKIAVTYFLNSEGGAYFSAWYEEIFKEIVQQDGFIEMNCDVTGNNPIVFLSFTHQEKLDLWASLERHDELFAKIEPFFITPVSVEILENNEDMSITTDSLFQ